MKSCLLKLVVLPPDSTLSNENNGLVNQVKFLQLVQALLTFNFILATCNTVCAKSAQKGADSQIPK